MRTFDVVAAQDVPTYGSFTVQADDPAAALAAATARLEADASLLGDAQPDSAHSLRIVALQEDDQDPLFADVSLDPDAPLWPGAAVRGALMETTSMLAQLVVSLGEAGEYPDELDRLAANLRLLGEGDAAAMALAAARHTTPPEAWAEQVMVWSFEQPPAPVAAR
jgi:hypothetical protein